MSEISFRKFAFVDAVKLHNFLDLIQFPKKSSISLSHGEGIHKRLRVSMCNWVFSRCNCGCYWHPAISLPRSCCDGSNYYQSSTKSKGSSIRRSSRGRSASGSGSINMFRIRWKIMFYFLGPLKLEAFCKFQNGQCRYQCHSVNRARQVISKA